MNAPSGAERYRVLGEVLDQALVERPHEVERLPAMPLWESWWVDRYDRHLLIQHPTLSPPPGAETVPWPGAVYWKPLGNAGEEHPRHLAGQPIEGAFEIRENGLRYEADFCGGYSTGIFHDQSLNRLRLRETLRPGMRMLNTFAYTCAFSVASAAAGAMTTSIDLSKRSLAWGRRNFGLNELSLEGHRFIAGDVAEWLGAFSRRGERFDAIVLDPPTFSRNHKGRIFRAETDLGELIARATPLLEPQGVLLVTVNTRRLPRGAMRQIVRDAVGDGWALEAVSTPEPFGPDPLLRGYWARRTG